MSKKSVLKLIVISIIVLKYTIHIMSKSHLIYRKLDKIDIELFREYCSKKNYITLIISSSRYLETFINSSFELNAVSLLKFCFVYALYLDFPKININS